MFAMDAWGTELTLAQRVTALAVHLIPVAIVLTIVLAAWRHEWVGGFSFLILSVIYAVWADFRIDWVAVISGPLALTGLLYFWSWRTARDVRT